MQKISVYWNLCACESASVAASWTSEVSRQMWRLYPSKVRVQFLQTRTHVLIVLLCTFEQVKKNHELLEVITNLQGSKTNVIEVFRNTEQTRSLFFLHGALYKSASYFTKNQVLQKSFLSKFTIMFMKSWEEHFPKFLCQKATVHNYILKRSVTNKDRYILVVYTDYTYWLG